VASDVVDDRVLHTVPVLRASGCPGGTRLALAGPREVEVPVAPDLDGARRVRGVLRRIERVDLDVDAAGMSASVTGIAHRRRHRMPVSVATALGLVVDGAVGCVTVSATTHRVGVAS
jgi:hypothetical protein